METLVDTDSFQYEVIPKIALGDIFWLRLVSKRAYHVCNRLFSSLLFDRLNFKLLTFFGSEVERFKDIVKSTGSLISGSSLFNVISEKDGHKRTIIYYYNPDFSVWCTNSPHSFSIFLDELGFQCFDSRWNKCGYQKRYLLQRKDELLAIIPTCGKEINHQDKISGLTKIFYYIDHITSKSHVRIEEVIPLMERVSNISSARLVHEIKCLAEEVFIAIRDFINNQ